MLIDNIYDLTSFGLMTPPILRSHSASKAKLHTSNEKLMINATLISSN
jgi:hypothetical protein